MCLGVFCYPPPPRVQEPAMFDRGTRGWFLRALFPLNFAAEPGVGSCAQPWATPYRGKKIFRRVAPGHACPLPIKRMDVRAGTIN